MKMLLIMIYSTKCSAGETARATQTSLNQHSTHVERNDRVGVLLLMSIRHYNLEISLGSWLRKNVTTSTILAGMVAQQHVFERSRTPVFAGRGQLPCLT